MRWPQPSRFGRLDWEPLERVAAQFLDGMGYAGLGEQIDGRAPAPFQNTLTSLWFKLPMKTLDVIHRPFRAGFCPHTGARPCEGFPDWQHKSALLIEKADVKKDLFPK